MHGFTVSRLLFVLMCLVVVTAGCQAPRSSVVEGLQGALAVAPFTQPQTSGDLLAGYIPDGATEVDPAILVTLDAELGAALRESTAPMYIEPGQTGRCTQIILSDYKGGRTAALDRWIKVGQCLGVDYLLVPQVLYWQKRVGSDLAVRQPAAVMLDLYLIDVKAEGVAKRYHFDEEQLSLSENILDADKFVKRKGKWITAVELAREGLARGVKEFGL